MATRTLAHEFHSIEPEEARVLLFDGGDCVLAGFAPGLSAKAAKILEGLGVELHLGVHVTDVRREGVTITPKAGGPTEQYAARTVLWTAGVEAVPFARHVAEVLGATSDHAGRIAVEPDLTVPGHPEVFVIGDLVGRLHQPRPRALAGRTRQALRTAWMAGLGLHPHRLPHRGAKSGQHRRDLAVHHRQGPAHRPHLHAGQPDQLRTALHLVGVWSRRSPPCARGGGAAPGPRNQPRARYIEQAI